jgi:hypothetical protein
MERHGRGKHNPTRLLHRVWLAGLGALAKARQEGGEDLFRELVEKGEELEALGTREGPGQTEASPEAEMVAESRVLLDYARILEGLVRQRNQTELLIEVMLPADVPTPPAVLQARRNAAAREELLREFGALTSSEVSDLAKSKARNKAALANRWKQEGRIFSVPHHGAAYFPTFQFDEQGRPRDAVAGVIEALGGKTSEWGLALWFTGAYGSLGGQRPVDLLDSDPGRVVEAAEREAEELVF